MKRFLKNVMAASSLLAVMSLVGCSQKDNGTTKDKVDDFSSLTAETDESIINELKLVNADGVYGNVYYSKNYN